MKFSQEFKSELVKAVKLSGFITVLVFGLLLIQNHTVHDTQTRSLASESSIEECEVDASGKSVTKPSRATKPYERKPCVPAKK